MSEVNDEEGKEVEISAMTHEGKHNVTEKCWRKTCRETCWKCKSWIQKKKIKIIPKIELEIFSDVKHNARENIEENDAEKSALYYDDNATDNNSGIVVVRKSGTSQTLRFLFIC